jgi:uncharacterized membrane protein YdfJ with MMPL/SSD domain
MIFDRIANAIQAHAKLVIILWVVILCCSAPFALKAGEVMSYDLNSMASDDSESIRGLAIMAEYFPSSADTSTSDILLLYFQNEEQMAAAQQFVKDLEDAVKDQELVTRVLSMDPMLGEKGTDGIILAVLLLNDPSNAVDSTPDVRAFINKVASETGYTGQHYLTGMAPISYDMEKNALEDVSRIDPFTVLMILILVGLFFRSFVSSATPPLTIGVAFAVTMALIFFLGQVLNIFFITNMMILVSMMGAGCDYCIFIIARYREELRKGLSHNEAVHQAIVWAGESITISGLSVIIGFGAMSICNYSMISTMGICLALGIIIALLAALTLIPSILQLVGDRVFWPTRMDAYEEGGKATKGWYAWFANIGAKYFDKSAHFSLKHAKAIAVAALLITVPAAYVVMESENSYDMITAMLSGESGEGMKYLGEYADQGLVMPNYSVVEYKDTLAKVTLPEGGIVGTLYWTDYYLTKVMPTQPKLYEGMTADDNVAYVSGPFVWDVMLAEIEEAGITDPDEKVKFIKDQLSAKNAMVFDTALQTMKEMGLDVSLIFDGPAGIIDNLFKQFDIDFSWNDEVALSMGKGMTDATEIVNDIVERFESEHTGESQQVLSTILTEVKKQGATDELLVYGFTITIDSVFALFPETYDWDAEVAKSKSRGYTDPNAIVGDIKSRFSTNYPGAPSTMFNTILDTMNQQGITNDVLVNGFGAMIDPMIQEFVPVVSWNAIVAMFKAMGITDPDVIVNTIISMLPEEYREEVQKMLDEMYAQGLTNDMLVNGMGSTISKMITSVPTDFSWARAVKQSTASGHSDPDDIINDVAATLVITNSAQASQLFLSIIEQIKSNGVPSAEIVFGFGPDIDNVFKSMQVHTTWEDLVQQSKDKGLTDPDAIVADIVKTFEEEYSPIMAGILKTILDTMHEKGLTNDMLVNGFGGVVDYVMNVTTAMVGGDGVGTKSWDATYISYITATEMAAMSPRSMESIKVIAAAVDDYVAEHSDIVAQKWDTGTAMVMYEVSESVQSQFTFIEILVVVLIILLLFVVMRSYLIPFRSVLTILMSICWTLAMTHLVFVTILGGEVIWVIPLILLVICLGLGMDYDILLTTRIKENVISLGQSNDDAIYNAVTHTGSVITICGLIMGGAFGTLMLSSIPMLQEFGFALCFAILVDALVVRTYIVPAIMHLLGDWNWKGPGSKFGKVRAQAQEAQETQVSQESRVREE